MSAQKSYKALLVALALLQGGYMVFDGVHELAMGTYFGGRVGPWAHIVRALHLRIESMGPVFVVIGAVWLLAALMISLNMRAARPLLTGVAIVTVAYPLFGTLLSLITLGTLMASRRRTREI